MLIVNSRSSEIDCSGLRRAHAHCDRSAFGGEPRALGLYRHFFRHRRGSDLNDVSLVKEIQNLEVLTLSRNSISSLHDLSSCKHLSELYLRSNCITSLSELHFLEALPRLCVLWLAGNPCCGSDPVAYRLSVLRCLPNLQLLDNQSVTEEERLLAQQEGKVIPPASIRASDACESVVEVIEAAVEDPVRFNLAETNMIRKELGLKPLPEEKFACSNSALLFDRTCGSKKSCVLEAVLLLLQELKQEELHIVLRTTEQQLSLLRS
uniref:Cilia and flagella associated protein 410 n=1 Tax=Eptatretus burgeri TaxID=7764 RepID=A0A8C4QV72_EPTBU